MPPVAVTVAADFVCAGCDGDVVAVVEPKNCQLFDRLNRLKFAFVEYYELWENWIVVAAVRAVDAVVVVTKELGLYSMLAGYQCCYYCCTCLYRLGYRSNLYWL